MAERDDGRYLQSLVDYLKGHFAKQKAMIRAMRSFRALTHEVKVPEDYKTTTQIVRSPILADMVQRIVATLTVNYPTWTRGLMGDAERDRSNVTLIQQWLPSAHLKMESQGRRRVFRMLMDAAIGDGMGVSQVLWRPDTYSPFPKRQRDEMIEHDGDPRRYTARLQGYARQKPFPFAWKDIDPLSYYFWDSHQGDREIVIVETVPIAPAARALGVRRAGGKWEAGKPGQPFPENDPGAITGDSGELWQHWTANGVTYCLDGEVAKTWQHGWGRHCIFDFSGLSTHERAPERAFLPVAFAFSELIPFLDRLLTMKANWMYLAAFPRAVLELSQERVQQMLAALPEHEQKRAADFGQNLSELGTLLLLYPGEKFNFVQPPPVGDDLNQLIQLTMGLIEQAGMGNVLRGSVPGNVDNGYLYNQATVAGRLAYDPITDNAKFMLRDQAEFLLWGVDQLVTQGKRADMAVPVWGKVGDKDEAEGWLELSAKHVGGIYATEPKLEPLLPSNLIMEGRFGLEQQQGGAISMYTHREKFLRVDPQEEEKRIAIERVKNSPPVQQMYDQKVAKEAGLLPEPMAGPLAALAAAAGQQPAPSGADMGNFGMPSTPGQGMPLDPSQVQRQGMPIAPNPQVLPGAGPAGQPGGNFGRQVVPNGG